MADWMDCGNVKDREGNLVKVEWDRDSGKIYLTGKWIKKYMDDKADNAQEALSKAHAWLQYQQ